jgi:hypothetical protein
MGKQSIRIIGLEYNGRRFLMERNDIVGASVMFLRTIHGIKKEQHTNLLFKLDMY